MKHRTFVKLLSVSGTVRICVMEQTHGKRECSSANFFAGAHGIRITIVERKALTWLLSSSAFKRKLSYVVHLCEGCSFGPMGRPAVDCTKLVTNCKPASTHRAELDQAEKVAPINELTTHLHGCRFTSCNCCSCWMHRQLRHHQSSAQTPRQNQSRAAGA